MPSDNERLQILIEGKVNDFEKAMRSVERKLDRVAGSANDNMRKTARASDRAARDIERDFTRANQRVSAQFKAMQTNATAAFGRLRGIAGAGLGALGVGAGAGLLGGIGAAAIVREANQVATSIADMNAETERAGLTFEQFQELKFAFDRERVSIDALVDGFKELQLRADEFIVTGKGPAEESFRRLGYGAQELQGKLEDVPELLLEIMDRAQDLDRAAQIRVFDELLGGTGGEQFVQLLSAGSGEIRKSIADARRLGAVMDNEVADRAAEVHRRFQDITSTIENKLKAGVVSLGEVVLDVAENIRDWGVAAGEFVKSLERTPEEILAALPEGSRLVSETERETARLANRIVEVNMQLADAQSAYEALKSVSEELLTVAQRTALSKLREDVQSLRSEFESLVAQAERLRDVGASVQINTPFPNGAPPGIGPTGSVGTVSNVEHYLAGRTTGDHVSTGHLQQAAAAGAAAVLTMFPGLQVSSAYRSPEYNRSIGGAPNSRHTHGDAVDFVGVDESQIASIVHALQSQGFRGFGYYGDGKLHADMGARRAWGPDRTSGSLGQTPLAFQRAVMAGPQLTPEADQALYQRSVAADDAQRQKAEQERLELLRQQNAERERQQEAIAAVNEALAAELEMAGYENEMLAAGKLTLDEVNAALDQESLVRQKLNELEAAGVQVTTEMEQAIRSKIGAIFDLQSANDGLVASQERVNMRTAEMAQAFQAVGQPILDTFLSIIDGSGKAEDAIKSLIKQIANMLIQGALFGGGPLGKLFGGGLFSSLFPGRAAGGPVAAGKPYVVGEKRPELFVPNVSGRIIPRLSDAMPSGGGGGGGSERVHVTVGVAADGNGNIKPFVQSVARQESGAAVRVGLEQYDRGLDRTILGKVDTAREKYS